MIGKILAALRSALLGGLRSVFETAEWVWAWTWRQIATPFNALLAAREPAITPAEAVDIGTEQNLDKLLSNKRIALKQISKAKEAAMPAAATATLGDQVKQRIAKRGGDAALRQEGERLLMHLRSGSLRHLDPETRAVLRAVDQDVLDAMIASGDAAAVAKLVKTLLAARRVATAADVHATPESAAFVPVPAASMRM